MRLCVSLAVAAGLFFAPLSVLAAPAAKTVTYDTTYRQTRPMATAGEVTGVLRLTFAPDGTVSGTYRDRFANGLHTVAGGVHGDSIWLSFGVRGGHQLRGTIEKDGKISGTITNWRGPATYQFTAVPTS